MTPAELREARHALGLSQRELADLLLMAQSGKRSVRRWEAADVPTAGPATAAVRLMLWVAKRHAAPGEAQLLLSRIVSGEEE